jgi:hypothetical protein
LSGIRDYRKEKLKKVNTSDNDTDDYKKRLRDHNLKKLLILVIIAILVVVGLIVLIVRIRKNNYSGYNIENTIRRTDSGYALYLGEEDIYIRCSKDGAAAYSYSGEAKWNKTYEVGNLGVDYAGNYLATADIGGNEIYFFNMDGHIATINTTLPIVKISVSEKGYVVAVLEDSEASYIDMYGKDGSKIYTIKTTPSSDGIPVDACVSPDGNKLVVAFTSIKGVDLFTSVDFYNFDVVGQNESERIVGGFNIYENQLVGDVEFLNETAVVAVAENLISFYTIKEYPKLINNVEITDRIEQIFYSDKNFAYVYTDDTGNQNIAVYDLSGERLYNVEVAEDYNSFSFTDTGIIMHGNKEYMLLNDKGKKVISGEFDGDISDIVHVDGKKYLFVSPDKLYMVKFK